MPPTEVAAVKPKLVVAVAASVVIVVGFTGGLAAVLLSYFEADAPADLSDGAGVRLAGGKKDVQIRWSAVVLLAPKAVAPDATPAEPYRAATPCCQSGADEVARVAAATWPPSGKAAEFAANVQRFVAESKRRE